MSRFVKDGNGNIIYVEDLVDHNGIGMEYFPGGIINSVDGLDMAGCKILKLSTGNALSIKQDVMKTVDDFIKENSGYNLKAIYTLDSTNTIKDGLGVLANSLVLSAYFRNDFTFSLPGKPRKSINTYLHRFGKCCRLGSGNFRLHSHASNLASESWLICHGNMP